MKIPYKALLLTPPALFALGFLMNSIVIAVNHGQMPVHMPGGCMPGALPEDPVHSCMTAATHLKALADWIWMGDAIASPGDLGIMAYDYISVPMLWLWIGLVVKEYLD